MEKKNNELTIKDLLDIFLPKMWLILIISIVFAAVSAVYSEYMVDDTYTSSASYRVLNDSANTSLSVSDLSYATALVPYCRSVFEGDSFYYRLRQELIGDEYVIKLSQEQEKDLSDVADLILAQTAITFSQPDTNVAVFKIAVTAKNADIATTVASAVHTITQATDDDSLCDILGEGTRVTFSPISNPRTATLNGKNTVRNGIIAFAMGFVLSIGGVFLYSILDVVIRDKKKLENNTDAPVLGVIPRVELANSLPVYSGRSVLNTQTGGEEVDE